MTVSNSNSKLIQSLDKKKYRQKYNLFVIEGNKIIKEIKNTPFEIHQLYTTDPQSELIALFPQTQLIGFQEMKKISFLNTPSSSLAVAKIKPNKLIPTKRLQLVLDEIQDPGNLGTIIRLCDWFGIEQIICSKETVDVYNPKVIQSSMGSFLRVNVFYTELKDFLSQVDLPIITTTLNGENVFSAKLPEEGYLVLGNEGNGISEAILQLGTKKITIPQFSTHKQTESLNVAMATAVILTRWIGR